MAINIHADHLLTLSDAARVLPAVGGRRPHPSTIWRWIRKGFKGVHLEHVRVGGRVCTSAEALDRFANALATADQEGSERPSDHQPVRVVTPADRSKSIANAEKILEQAGI